MSEAGQHYAEALLGAFPPGVPERLAEGPGSPLAHIGAAGETLASSLGSLDELADSATPLTASAGRLSEWERLLGLPVGRGTVAARRAAVISRLRARGAPTLAMVRGVLAPLLDADPASIVILEADRDALRALHTYRWAGSLGFGLVAASFKVRVADDAKVSGSGAQLDLTLTHDDLTTVTVQLTAPDGTTKSRAGIGRGAVADDTVRVFFKDMAGAAAGGTLGGLWTVTIMDLGLSGTVAAAGLFVEGQGRDATRRDGLGAAAFSWAAVADPTVMGPGADLDAARAALSRISYAARPGGLVEPNETFGDVAALPVEAVPGATVPGS